LPIKEINTETESATKSSPAATLKRLLHWKHPLTGLLFNNTA